MAESVKTRLAHAWNAFRSREGPVPYANLGPSTSRRPDRPHFRTSNEKTIIMGLHNRIAMDVAAISIRHVRLDEEDRYSETIKSGLNSVLSLEANIDQTSTALIQDIMLSLFDEGVVAVVPVDTTVDPKVSGSFDIQTMRTGKILEWMPRHIRVRLYDDKTGLYQEIPVPKESTAIIENPLYAVMNEPNGTYQRLIRKLSILDAIDEQSGSGKLDLIIQLPYVVKTPAKREQAETRRKDIELQLTGSKYGVAYTDGTEKITQLNRPVENNLMAQIEFLTSMLYSQLGISKAVFDGTADEAAMLNYEAKTVLPLVKAITLEFTRKFITKTGRSQRQAVMSFRDVFARVPAEKMADMADKFGRNEIMAGNEFRQILGLKPSKQPGADDLRNKNIPEPTPPGAQPSGGPAGGVTPEQLQAEMESGV